MPTPPAWSQMTQMSQMPSEESGSSATGRRSFGGLQDMDHRGGAGAAGVVREADAGALDLPALGRAAQLPHDLAHLRDARGAGGVAARLEAAAGIDDDLAVEAGAALRGGGPALAFLDEAEVLDGQDLGLVTKGEGGRSEEQQSELP